MIKTILIIGALLMLSMQPPKTLKVEGDLNRWQVLLDCLDKSNANHSQVKAVQDWILSQLQKQLADSTKKDTLKKK